jgi:hypothetical protein
MGCLYAGCVYRVRIRAQNASGWGQYSVPCDVKAAAGVPHAPTAPKAVGQSAIAIELAWEAPQHDGGSDIISYRLEMSSGISSSARLHQIIHGSFHKRDGHVPALHTGDTACHPSSDLTLMCKSEKP